MKNIKLAVTQMGLLVALMVISVACSSSGSGGGGGTGEGIYDTTWTVSVYEDGYLIDGGYVSIDGSGNLSGEVGEGTLSGSVNGDGSAAAWTISGSSTASGSFNGTSGTGSGNWSDTEGYSGRWEAVRR